MRVSSLLLMLFPPSFAPAAGFSREIPSAAEIHSTLEEVFNRPELRPPVKSWAGRLWEAILEKISEVVVWLLSWLGKGLSAPGVSTIVIIILCALLVLILARMAIAVLRQKGGAASGGLEARAARVLALSPDPHLALAREHASLGRFHEAMRSLYLGVVLWLDGKRLARYDASKTGGEYLREISTGPASSPFGSLLRVFYPVEFGGRPVARAHYEKMQSLAREMGVPA
jgi:hypothetical protein